MKPILLAVVLLVSAIGEACGAEPPYWGTIYIQPAILTELDPTAFTKATYVGTGKRRMYDRRRGWVQLDAHLLNAQFDDGSNVEVQVNPEIDRIAAEGYANKYLPSIGRLPLVLRSDLQTIWIHRGDQPLGGGNNNLLLHTEYCDDHLSKAILEETLIHEAAHTSLDSYHATSPRWEQAQKLDGQFISGYARDNVKREDIAESFLLYLALRWKPDRLTQEQREQVVGTIPNRIKYFDSLDLKIHPLSKDTNWKVYPWTAKSGETVYGKFLSATEQAVAISVHDEKLEFGFEGLSPESRTLARELAK